jgi:hypothetical protein
MDWEEPALVERKYQISSDRVPIIARLGFPRPTEREDEWECSFQICGSGDSRVQVARGVDGLQALTIAVSAIRQWLDNESDVTSTETPYEMVFPRYVPFAHGLEYHRQLCRLLDEQIERQEQELAASRAARERGPH